MMTETILAALLLGWFMDLVFGDPQCLPHPVVLFGRMISFMEHRLNHGTRRKLKGAFMAVTLVFVTFFGTWALLTLCFKVSELLTFIVQTTLIFFCLAGTTLIREVRSVFNALDRSLDEGRRQVARIVGRDTSQLSAQEVRAAALETLAENLSDGVVAPLFWLMIGGVPSMMAYKMVNTMDSMVGYHTERYIDFGCFAARLDDAANYLPARLTAFLMLLGMWRLDLFGFVRRFGRCHASPNSGYPESALAGILDCRFGGPHYYFGELFPKPYIGTNDRELTTADMLVAVRTNRRAEVLTVLLCSAICLLL